MPTYLQIALGILLAALLLTQAAMIRDLVERLIAAALQVVRDVLKTLERIFSAAFRAFAR